MIGLGHTRRIQPIETRYNGYRFRSRLEARWAVFMDALGVRYDYEPEGFALGQGLRYLPDFWVPSLDAYLEIKPTEPGVDSIDWEKVSGLARQSLKAVYVFFGPISVPVGDWRSPENGSALAFFAPAHAQFQESCEGWWFAYWWCVCPGCHAPAIAFAGRPQNLPCGCTERSGGGECQSTYDAPVLLSAYARARSARFEFGEKG